MEFIKESLMSLGTGAVVGAIFAFMKLPLPAPSFIGWLGIGGLVLGYAALNKII